MNDNHLSSSIYNNINGLNTERANEIRINNTKFNAENTLDNSKKKKNQASNIIKKGFNSKINIAVYNINGIKNNKQKIDLLVCWLEENIKAICGLIEMNISAKESKWCLGKDSKYAIL